MLTFADDLYVSGNSRMKVIETFIVLKKQATHQVSVCGSTSSISISSSESN